jgi:predicted nucleic acid-binding protein
MTGFEFFDSNILLYSSFDDKSGKYEIATKLIKRAASFANPHISVQVLNEFTDNALRKQQKSFAEVKEHIDRFKQSFTILDLTPDIFDDALRIAEQYQFRIWDAQIVAAALYADCVTLYTEDLQDGQVIDGALTVRNPFEVKMKKKRQV